MTKKKKIISTVSAGVILIALVVATAVCITFKGVITTALDNIFNKGGTEGNAEVANNADLISRKLAEEGIVLLQNEDMLPLDFDETSEKINVFGWSSTDNGFLLRGIGSGSSTISKDKTVTFLQGLTDAGFEYNQDLIDFYKSFYNKEFSFKTGSNDRVALIEPNLSEYGSLLDDAWAYSENAIVVISRVGGENIGEVPQIQKKYKYADDTTRNYLQFSTEEEALLEKVAEDYNTIVVINSANQMELSYLQDIGVKAVLNVGLLGQSGASAIGKILTGEVNPSGRLTDTFAYDYKSAPSYVNYLRNGNHIQYAEDIYYGYKWYETADAEGYFNNVRNDYGTGYDGVVQYPFGYGLSYSTFSWTLTDSNLKDGAELTKDGKIELTFSCTNTGDAPGKDVMQVYYSAPYEKGEIEKSAVNLIDFAKSKKLAPGETEKDIKISFDVSDMASFDCYDKNKNGSATYELDGSTKPYVISFRENAHELKNMTTNKLNYYVKSDIIYDKDPVTKNDVVTRFTGNNAYAGVPIDGTTAFNSISYLSRADFAGTFPKPLAVGSNIKTNVVDTANGYTNTSYNQTSMPTLDQNNELYLFTKEDGSKASLKDLEGGGEKTVINEELVKKIGSDYESDELNNLIDQMSANDVCSIVEDGGFGTRAIESIGKRKALDKDGPAGFNDAVLTIGENDTSPWTAFPCETLIGQTFNKDLARQMGLLIGLEGQSTGISGWYGPGVNIHRSPFNNRNYEYYSEDPILSGIMAANVVLGAKANGVYAYIKHLTLSEPGQNARDLNTWLTEQNFRENYLKPFEIAVKKGEANAMMTAFNFVGGVWAGACKAQNVDVLRDEWGFRGSVITDYSQGDGSMNTKKGVRAGNDLWLNPNAGSNFSKLSRTDATEVYCAKLAAKNIIYTYCNTYNFKVTYDHSQDDFHILLDDYVAEPPSEWWFGLLIGIDVVSVLGILVWMYFVWLRQSKPKVEEN